MSTDVLFRVTLMLDEAQRKALLGSSPVGGLLARVMPLDEHPAVVVDLVRLRNNYVAVDLLGDEQFLTHEVVVAAVERAYELPDDYDRAEFLEGVKLAVNAVDGTDALIEVVVDA